MTTTERRCARCGLALRYCDCPECVPEERREVERRDPNHHMAKVYREGERKGTRSTPDRRTQGSTPSVDEKSGAAYRVSSTAPLPSAGGTPPGAETGELVEGGQGWAWVDQVGERPAETLVERLGFCRRMLYLHGLITDGENRNVRDRITTRTEAGR